MFFNPMRALLMAGMRLGIPAAAELFRPTAMPPMPVRHRYRGNVGRASRTGESPQSPDSSRLHRDHSSSIRKLQRWNRAGMVLWEPNEAAKRRHAWYRRQKAREAFRATLPEENLLNAH